MNFDIASDNFVSVVLQVVIRHIMHFTHKYNNERLQKAQL